MTYTNCIFTFLTTLIFFSCEHDNATVDKVKNRNLQIESDKIANKESKKIEYELANEFLVKLKNDKVDTIIIYERTCINCCDFYNIFWSAKGQNYLAKFYFDFDDMKTHSQIISLSTNKLIKVINDNFIELKNTSIKENTHKQKDGKSINLILDHYCYSKIKIYTSQDSIITDEMKD